MLITEMYPKGLRCIKDRAGRRLDSVFAFPPVPINFTSTDPFLRPSIAQHALYVFVAETKTGLSTYFVQLPSHMIQRGFF